MEREDLYGNFQKVVQFHDSDKRYADLRIRLHYDEIRQGEFFRGLVMGYLERDEDLMKFLNKLKDKIERQSDKKRRKIKRSDKKRKETVDKFGLNEEELESIFDMIEEEHNDL